jgi:hypothetical protein
MAMEASPERTGVMVIRVWLEISGPRARIIHTLDPEGGEDTVCVVGSADEIQAAVTEWLRRVRASGGLPTHL